jgi:hypothetical protein
MLRSLSVGMEVVLTKDLIKLTPVDLARRRQYHFKRVAAFVGMDRKNMQGVSGHSIRVGATQHLLALNIDLASVMQAGRMEIQ